MNLDELLDQALQLLSAQRGCFLCWDEHKQEFALANARDITRPNLEMLGSGEHGHEPGEFLNGLLKQAMQGTPSLYVVNSSYVVNNSIAIRMVAMILVPCQLPNGVRGLYLDRRSRDGEFSQNDLQALTTLLNSAP